MFNSILILATAVLAHTPIAEIHLTREKCALLIVNNKADESINYKPGVDTRGKKVAPADLPGSSAPKDYKLGDSVHINMSPYLGKLYTHPTPVRTGDRKDFVTPVIDGSQASFGSIDIHKDGKLWINGVPAFDEDQSKVEAACRLKFPHL